MHTMQQKQINTVTKAIYIIEIEWESAEVIIAIKKSK